MAWVGEVREWKRGVCGKSHSSQGVGWRPALISPIIALYLNSKKKKTLYLPVVAELNCRNTGTGLYTVSFVSTEKKLETFLLIDVSIK